MSKKAGSGSKKNEQTSPSLASLAAHVLSTGHATQAEAAKLAGGVLTSGSGQAEAEEEVALDGRFAFGQVYEP